ncbi:MAG: HAMP domain-containing histidine kinase [Actinomycetota bacterium]|nr:HAMP domain-containing histidine kinase [Actinomycetota bacterium]
MRRPSPRAWLGVLRRIPLTRRLGLRARITLAFAIGALLLSALLSGTTWALTRENLLNQREDSAKVLVFQNARTIQARVTDDTDQQALLSSLSTRRGAQPILYFHDQFVPLTPEFGQDAIPPALRRVVITEGRAASMRYELRGEMELAIGVPIPSADAAYFEIISLGELESTLDALGVSLVGASLVTTLAGAALGWWAARRALRPLIGVSQAAHELGQGRLDTRLEPSEDRDLQPITASFNEMAQALQSRVEHDARFASDVSHELRSPLMTLAASVEVMNNQRDDLPERAVAALDLMVADISRFQQLVEDLLEISRFDAGVARLELEEVHLAELVMQAVSHSTEADVPVELEAALAGVVVHADKRRIVRVIANLLDNASKYGGGATSVSLRRVDDDIQIAVEDRGEGVPEEDRELIFSRFARGSAAGRRGSSEGVGLGLALVAEHVNLHGGKVWVEDRADSEPGARFVLELPVEDHE